MHPDIVSVASDAAYTQTGLHQNFVEIIRNDVSSTRER